MTVLEAAPDVPHALALVGLPYPGGNPQVLHAHAEAHRALAADLQRHADTLADLIGRSQQAWQGEAADAFHSGAAQDAARLSDTAQAVTLIGDVHEAHATHQAKALHIIAEIATQIGVLLAMIAAVAFFPPLLSALEVQLAALAATAGRLISWLADLLSAVVRFLVQARAWISQISSLTWRTESFSFAYGRAAFEGLRDAAVDVLASLTARGISHKPLDLTMLWTALGSGVGGGLFGAIEGSGLKKVLTESGETARSADGTPVFMSIGDQAKNRLKSLGSAKGRAARRGTAGGDSVPSASEIDRALGGASTHAVPTRARLAEPAPASRAEALDKLLLARAQLRKLGLEGLPRERQPMAAALADAKAEHSAAAAARQLAGQRLDDARSALASASHRVTERTRVAAKSSARAWAAETSDALRLRPPAGGGRRIGAGRPVQAPLEAGYALDAARSARDAAARRMQGAEQAVHSTSSAAAAARASLSAAQARSRAWENFAAAGRAADAHLSFPSFLSGMWQRNPWREGFATEYGRTAQAGVDHVPTAWVETNVGGLSSVVLDAIGAPKTWREALVYEPVKGLLKGATAGTTTTALSYRPGTSNPLAWLAVPLAGAGGALRDLAKAPMVNRLFPDRSVEESLVRVGLGALGKQTQAPIMEQAVPPNAQRTGGHLPAEPGDPSRLSPAAHT